MFCLCSAKSPMQSSILSRGNSDFIAKIFADFYWFCTKYFGFYDKQNFMLLSPSSFYLHVLPSFFPALSSLSNPCTITLDSRSADHWRAFCFSIFTTRNKSETLWWHFLHLKNIGMGAFRNCPYIIRICELQKFLLVIVVFQNRSLIFPQNCQNITTMIWNLQTTN